MKITDDIFKSIFNEGVWISITISLKFVPKGLIDYKSALVQAGNGLAPNRRETITRINADQIHRRIYTALNKMYQTLVKRSSWLGYFISP